MTEFNVYCSCIAEEPGVEGEEDVGAKDSLFGSEQQVPAEQVASLPQEPNTDAATEQVTPSPQPPSTEAGPSSCQPVPDRLADMLLTVGTSFRYCQNIPDCDPEQMINWMNSSLASMNMVYTKIISSFLYTS
jgi:hypothetical protein